MHPSPQEFAEKLIEFGASDARVIPSRSIVVEDRFADMCSAPQCPSYGLAPSCPPHSMKPSEFRSLLSKYEYALVFKIDVPIAMLMGEDRRDVARVIHELSSNIEHLAQVSGYANAKGLAGGSCKEIFCHDQVRCVVLEGKEKCPFADTARPSISGIGVNFLELCKTVGWKANIITQETTPDQVSMGMMAGIVLLG